MYSSEGRELGREQRYDHPREQQPYQPREYRNSEYGGGERRGGGRGRGMNRGRGGGGFRDGRGGGRGGGFDNRENKREFDRRSGSDKTYAYFYIEKILLSYMCYLSCSSWKV